LDRSLSARVSVSEQTMRHSSVFVRQKFAGVGCRVVLIAKLPELLAHQIQKAPALRARASWEENAAPHHVWDNTIKAFRSFKADLRLLTPPSRPSSPIRSKWE